MKKDLFYEIFVMVRRLLFLFFIIFSLQISADDKKEQLVALNGIKKVESLPVVYGWHRNQKSDKWTIKSNEISGVDKFQEYCMVLFKDSNFKEYILIIKTNEHKGNLIIDSYILDYSDYVDKISAWDEYAILKFPILKHKQSVVKKNTPLSEELVGIDDLSDLIVKSRNYFVFQYKFQKDSTVKFLFYTELCSSGTCQIEGLNVTPENTHIYKYLERDELYNTLFYKTTIKYFTDFLDLAIK